MVDTNEKESLRVLSGLYSASTLKQLLSGDESCVIQSKISRHKKCIIKQDFQISFRDLMTKLYKSMSKNYCNEYVYKNSVLNKLLLKKYELKNTTLLNEFKIGKSIADLVFINGEVKLFEIKTELDTLNRLETQLCDYKKVAEKIYIVVSNKHINHIISAYKESSFGIIELTIDLKLKIHKEADIDNAKFDYIALFKLLRKAEYENIIKEKYGAVPQVPNTLLFKSCLELARQIEINEFQSLVFKQLKKRKLREPELLTSINTPAELRFLCHSMDLDKKQYFKLFKALNEAI